MNKSGMFLFRRMSVIGFGLIGSSLARGVRRAGLAEEIVAVDQDPENRAAAEELELADVITGSVAEGVRGADLVVVAVPMGAFETVGRQMASTLEAGCIVTDVGSVKQTAVKTLSRYVPKEAHFIPGHPIAGTEFSGARAGFADLFKDRWTILTPTPDSDVRAIEKIVALWEGCGAKIDFMEPKHHDMVLGITSHLPHLIAYTIVGTAADLEDETKAEVIKYSASGFRDFTRIAASDPVMWRDIFLNNKDAVLDILQRFNEDLTALQRAIRREEGDVLEAMFARTRAIRKQVVEAGQARPRDPIEYGEGAEPVEAPKKSSASQG